MATSGNQPSKGGSRQRHVPAALDPAGRAALDLVGRAALDLEGRAVNPAAAGWQTRRQTRRSVRVW